MYNKLFTSRGVPSSWRIKITLQLSHTGGFQLSYHHKQKHYKYTLNKKKKTEEMIMT